MDNPLASQQILSNSTQNGSNEAGMGVTRDEKRKVGTVSPAKTSIMDQLGLNVGVLLMMFKGACSPVIALALYQWNPFAHNYPTLGYLVAIASILATPIMPRTKFIQTMTFNILGICFGACIALLTCYCSVQARINTSMVLESSATGASGSSQATVYNSSASAVSAIWLFVNIVFANALRFSRPQLQITIILYSIFANVAGTFAPLFASMTQGIAFVKTLLEAFLGGFGIATVVHFVVFPTSVRQVLMAQYASTIKAFQEAIASEKEYFQSMERPYLLDQREGVKYPPVSKADLAANDVKARLSAIAELTTKLHTDLPFAKREVAWGKLSAKDLEDIREHFRQIFLPLLGLGSVIEIFNKLTDAKGWSVLDSDDEAHETKQAGDPMERTLSDGQNGWKEIMQIIHQPFESVSAAVIEGLDHAAFVLELTKNTQAKKQQNSAGGLSVGREDVEAGASKLPGEGQYSVDLEARLKGFNEARKKALRVWCAEKGVRLDEIGEEPKQPQKDFLESTSEGSYREQLYLILYTEYLLYSTARAVLEFAKYADKKVEDGTMKRNRLILPGRRRVLKWIKNSIKVEDAPNDLSPDSAEAGVSSLHLGDAFERKKDPERLPPTTLWQKAGYHIWKTSSLLSTPEVAFGFRVGCATMTIGIVAFLQSSQAFFTEQRLVWAMIMVAIGMTMTSGSGVFGLVGRCLGTLIATVVAIVIWYIAGGRGVPGGVLPVLFFVIFIEHYFLLKFPKFTVVSLLTIVTQILILGYELQVEQVGAGVQSAAGQVYYPIYELAPYRLATVVGGCFVAFIWTYFPYPITARTALRVQLGETMYLLANYYSCVHTTVRMRLLDTGGDPTDKNSPSKKLEKARNKVLIKVLSLVGQLRQHMAFVPYEFSLGGKFPKKTYNDMIEKAQHLLEYMALLDYSTRVYERDRNLQGHSQWFEELSAAARSIQTSSQEITGLLILISSSLVNSSALPPYLIPPRPFELTTQVNAMDPDILSLRHILEPGYAAFAVTQVAGKLIDSELRGLIEDVKALVGEVDFSFQIVSTGEKSSETSSLLGDKGKGKKD